MRPPYVRRVSRGLGAMLRPHHLWADISGPEPGSITISVNVHEQVEGKQDERFDDAGAHEIKNIAWPIAGRLRPPTTLR